MKLLIAMEDRISSKNNIMWCVSQRGTFICSALILYALALLGLHHSSRQTPLGRGWLTSWWVKGEMQSTLSSVKFVTQCGNNIGDFQTFSCSLWHTAMNTVTVFFVVLVLTPFLCLWLQKRLVKTWQKVYILTCMLCSPIFLFVSFIPHIHFLLNCFNSRAS